MKNRKSYLPIYILIMIAGIGLLFCGIFLSKQLDNPFFEGFCTALGIIIFSTALSKVATTLSLSEQKQKELEIELKDERNTAIREKAAWSAGKILIPLMGMGAFVLALTEQYIGACVMAGILLIYSISIILFSNYYSKKL